MNNLNTIMLSALNDYYEDTLTFILECIHSNDIDVSGNALSLYETYIDNQKSRIIGIFESIKEAESD